MLASPLLQRWSLPQALPDSTLLYKLRPEDQCLGRTGHKWQAWDNWNIRWVWYHHFPWKSLSSSYVQLNGLLQGGPADHMKILIVWFRRVKWQTWSNHMCLKLVMFAKETLLIRLLNCYIWNSKHDKYFED